MYSTGHLFPMLSCTSEVPVEMASDQIRIASGISFAGFDMRSLWVNMNPRLPVKGRQTLHLFCLDDPVAASDDKQRGRLEAWRRPIIFADHAFRQLTRQLFNTTSMCPQSFRFELDSGADKISERTSCRQFRTGIANERTD